MDYLLNINNSKCKTCLFGDSPIDLTEDRLVEIKSYLTNLESSHICHTTNKTCLGGAELMAKSMYDKGMIPAPDVETMVSCAKFYLRKK